MVRGIGSRYALRMVGVTARRRLHRKLLQPLLLRLQPLRPQPLRPQPLRRRPLLQQRRLLRRLLRLLVRLLRLRRLRLRAARRLLLCRRGLGVWVPRRLILGWLRCVWLWARRLLLVSRLRLGILAAPTWTRIRLWAQYWPARSRSPLLRWLVLLRAVELLARRPQWIVTTRSPAMTTRLSPT